MTTETLVGKFCISESDTNNLTGRDHELIIKALALVTLATSLSEPLEFTDTADQADMVRLFEVLAGNAAAFYLNEAQRKLGRL